MKYKLIITALLLAIALNSEAKAIKRVYSNKGFYQYKINPNKTVVDKHGRFVGRIK